MKKSVLVAVVLAACSISSVASAGFVVNYQTTPLTGTNQATLGYAVYLNEAGNSEDDSIASIGLDEGEYAYLYQLTNNGPSGLNVYSAGTDFASPQGGFVTADSDTDLSEFQDGTVSAAYQPTIENAVFTFNRRLADGQTTNVLYYTSMAAPGSGNVSTAGFSPFTGATGTAAVAVPLPPVFALILGGMPFVGLLRRRRQAV